MMNLLQDEIRKLMQAQGRFLLGIANINYPVYLLHLDYKKPNDDPMYFIDQAICDLIRKQPNVDWTSLSSIIGMDEKLILYRFDQLKRDGYIKQKKNEYYLTSKCMDYFFNKDNYIPYIDVSTDLLIDGITLSLLPSSIYESYRFLYQEAVLVHKIINCNNEIEPLLNKIEKMTDTNKAKFHFEAGSTDLRLDGVPTKCSISISIVFSQDDKLNIYKEIYYDGKKVSLPGLKPILSQSTLGDFAQYSYGYGDDNSNKNVAFSASNKNYNYMINSCLGVDINYSSTNSIKENGIMCALITSDILKVCNEPLVLKKYYINGYCDYYSKNEDSFISFKLLVQDEKIIKLFEFDNDIVNTLKTGDVENVLKFCKVIGITEARKNLLLLKRYDLLEQIDNKMYVQKYNS